MNTLSGGEQKRLVLEAPVDRPRVLALDEADNYLDVRKPALAGAPAGRIRQTVLLIGHDRELPLSSVDRDRHPGTRPGRRHPPGPTPAPTAAGARPVNATPGSKARRWDEEHAKLKALVLMYKQKAAYNDGLASRYQAAQTRLAKFEALPRPGPPGWVVTRHQVRMRLRSGQTARPCAP